ncbi:MAG: hypothetical protein ABWK00_03450, partial [Desulfurococcaceae archaeon]
KQSRDSRKVEKFDVDAALRERGYVKCKLLVFDLPTEYRGAETKYEVEEGGRVREVKVFASEPTVYRSLRRGFYSALHEVAFRTKAGWVLVSESLGPLEEYVKELRKLASEFAVEVVDAYLPIDWTRREAEEYVKSLLERREEIARKLADEAVSAAIRRRLERERERIERAVRVINDFLSRLK